jgi:pimeloyl-ACP methyl ester carboxylesterase
MSAKDLNSNQLPIANGLRRVRVPLTVDQAVAVSFKDVGHGRPVLLLHGGGGPSTVNAFAEQFATDPGSSARLITPVHPGFDGTERPAGLDSIKGLAELYVKLLDELDVSGAMVVGNSIGGWIAAEIAILDSDRVSGYVIVDGVGVEFPDHPVVDFYSLTPAEVAQRAYHDPERFGIDPSKLPPEALRLMAGNREALAVYAGATMTDPTLGGRLGSIAGPALVVWGQSDRIADPGYGRALSGLIPGAEFVVMPDAGHLPQIETPGELIRIVRDFADRHGAPRD